MAGSISHNVSAVLVSCKLTMNLLVNAADSASDFPSRLAFAFDIVSWVTLASLYAYRSPRCCSGWRSQTRTEYPSASEENACDASWRKSLETVSSSALNISLGSLTIIVVSRPIPYLLITNGGGHPDGDRRRMLSADLGQKV